MKYTEKITVDKNGCWNYHTKGGNRGPYRKYYEHYKEPIPRGKVVMHTCDNKKCVNPEHLVVGTQTENLHDSSGLGQTKKFMAGLIKEKHFSSAAGLYIKRKKIFGY